MFLRYWFPIAVVGLVLLALPAHRLVRVRTLRLRRQRERLARKPAWTEPPHRPVHLGRRRSLSGSDRPVAALLPQAQAQAAGGAEHVPVEEEHRGSARQSPVAVAAEEHPAASCNCSCLLAAIYAVLAPRMHGTEASGRHYILMIDNSASMSATDVQAESAGMGEGGGAQGDRRRHRCRLRHGHRLQLDGRDPPVVHDQPRAAASRPSRTSSRQTTRRRSTRRLSLAASLANPLFSTEDAAVRPENPEPGKERTYAAAEGIQADVHLYSDGRFADVPNFALANLQMTFHSPVPRDGQAVGRDADNVGIVRFDAVRDEQDPTQAASVRPRAELPERLRRRSASIWTCYSGGKSVQDVRHRDLPLAAARLSSRRCPTTRRQRTRARTYPAKLSPSSI